MGVYISETEKYTIKYDKNNLEDLKNILDDVLHYFFNDYGDYFGDNNGSWVYITDQKKIKKRFEHEEYRYNLDGRIVNIDTRNKLLSIIGSFEREHGEGTHLEVNKDYLFEKLFEYDPNIIIIEEDENMTDASSFDNFQNDTKIIYMIDGKVRWIHTDNNLEKYKFDKIVDQSDLKYFTIKKCLENINIIKENVENISKLNANEYHYIFKDCLTEDDIIELVKKDFSLIESIDNEIKSKIINDKKILKECIKNVNLVDLDDIDYNAFDASIIIDDKDLLLAVLNNGKNKYYINELLDDGYCEETIEDILDKYGDDKDIIMALIRNYNYSYYDVPYHLKNDKDILIEAVKVGCRYLKDAPMQLRDDEELLKELMKINPKVYQYASKRLATKYKPTKSKTTKTKEKSKVKEGTTQLSLFD